MKLRVRDSQRKPHVPVAGTGNTVADDHAATGPIEFDK